MPRTTLTQQLAEARARIKKLTDDRRKARRQVRELSAFKDELLRRIKAGLKEMRPFFSPAADRARAAFQGKTYHSEENFGLGAFAEAKKESSDPERTG